MYTANTMASVAEALGLSLPGAKAHSMRWASSALMVPASTPPTASNESMMVMSFSVPSSRRTQPGAMEPAYRNTEARSSRAAAISIPGIDLSQPASSTEPSSRSASITTSTESAMTSRLTSEKCIPSWPIEMPSETDTVPNWSG